MKLWWLMLLYWGPLLVILLGGLVVWLFTSGKRSG